MAIQSRLPEQWRKSGLSQRKCCERKGISLATFPYWRSKDLRSSGSQQLYRREQLSLRLSLSDLRIVVVILRSSTRLNPMDTVPLPTDSAFCSVAIRLKEKSEHYRKVTYFVPRPTPLKCDGLPVCHESYNRGVRFSEVTIMPISIG